MSLEQQHLTKLSIPKKDRDTLKAIAKKERLTMLGMIRLWCDKYRMLEKINSSTK